MTQTKSIAYAYPSSPAAVLFGHGKIGCFMVSIIDHTPEPQPPRALSGHLDRDDAHQTANALPHSWDRFSL